MSSLDRRCDECHAKAGQPCKGKQLQAISKPHWIRTQNPDKPSRPAMKPSYSAQMGVIYGR